MAIQAEKFIIHPTFDANNGDISDGYDIAIIKLPWKHRITYGWLPQTRDYLYQPVGPVCLPPKGYEDVEEKCETLGTCYRYTQNMPHKCMVSGWGMTKPRK